MECDGEYVYIYIYIYIYRKLRDACSVCLFVMNEVVYACLRSVMIHVCIFLFGT